MKSTILITGGAGFVGNALAQKLKQKYNVFVLDNFSSSQTHPVYKELFSKDESLVEAKFDNIHYIRGNTWDIKTLCQNICPVIVFHFGEFSRINESWTSTDVVYKSNLFGTSMVLDYCVSKKSFLVYSASSAILGNEFQTTPYTFTKSVMVNMVKHYAEWHGLEYIVTYFYNVYGKGQVESGPYATVMGIFEKCYREGLKYPVVEPGTQSRIFTHIDDIVRGIIASLDFTNKDVPIASNDECSIKELALRFGKEEDIEYLPQRKGDRAKSTKILDDILRSYGWSCNQSLDEYISKILS